jgi:hypothetical protein
MHGIYLIELIRDNFDLSALVKLSQNPPIRSRVVANTSATNQVPDHLINMRRICRWSISSETKSIQVNWLGLVKIRPMGSQISSLICAEFVDDRTHLRQCQYISALAKLVKIVVLELSRTQARPIRLQISSLIYTEFVARNLLMVELI